MSHTRNEDVSNLILLAPLQGWVAPLDEVPDPVFADRMMGDGLAIDPIDSTLYAPCDGVVVSSTPHAVTLKADCGAEILVHIGLETVALGGKGFSSQTGQGERVKARMPLLKFDLEFLAPRVKSLISPIVVANGEAFGIVRRAENREIKVGDFLMEIAPLAVMSETGDVAISREVVIASTHGLHARPAALLSRRAKEYAADIELRREGRRANVKSAVALMALGAQRGDKLILSAKGTDASQAIAALAQLIETASHEPPAPDRIVRPSNPVGAAGASNVVPGIMAAPGLAVGPAVHLLSQYLQVDEASAGISDETAAFHRALSEIEARLETGRIGRKRHEARYPRCSSYAAGRSRNSWTARWR